LKQAGVMGSGTAERELRSRRVTEVTDRFPHQQAVGAQVLERVVRSSELVEGLMAELKEDPTGDRLTAEVRKKHEAVSRRDHILMNQVEETARLWRDPLASAGQAMESVVIVNRFARVEAVNLDPLPA
jgi:hypothetical protein